MIEAVFTFGLVSALFEFVILMKLKPRTRLRVLGSRRWVVTIHFVTFLVNIVVHYGTITGSMSAIVAALASFATVPIARWVSGYIKHNSYVRGLISYKLEELR